MTAHTYPSRMNDFDTVLHTIEDDPLLRSTIVSLFLLDSVPDRSRLRAAVERMTHAVPRLRQCVVTDPLRLATPRWLTQADVDLDYHLRWVRVGGAGSVDDVLALAEPLAMQAFDPARPLWEWTVVEGLADGGAALLLKTHHAITDGVGAIELALQLFDLERTPPQRELPPAPEVEQVRWFDGLSAEAKGNRELASAATRTGLRATAELARHPRRAIRTAGDAARALPKIFGGGAPLSDLMTGRSLSMEYGLLQFPLAAFKATGRAADGKVNDVVLAGIASGMHAYHRKNGSAVTELRISMMVNTRTETSGPGGNEFAPIRFTLPLAEADAGRVSAIHSDIRGLLAEPTVPMTRPLTGVARRLPKSLCVAMLGRVQRSVDVISSNVPGWPVTVYLAGAQVTRSIGLGPLAGAAVNVTIMSYAGQLNVGVTIDSAAVPDKDVLLDCLQHGFEDVLEIGQAGTR